MTNASESLLQSFAEAPWLSKCAFDNLLEGVSRVASWKDASRMCKKRFHENVQTASRNALTSQLHAVARDRYRHWNDIVNSIRPQVDDITLRQIAKNEFGFKIDETVRLYIRIDLMMALMESEYQDIVPPRYFAERAKWYLAGHFPCGWDGDFPEGRLFVF